MARLRTGLALALLVLSACGGGLERLPAGATIRDGTIQAGEVEYRARIAEVTPEVMADTLPLMGRAFIDSEYEARGEPVAISSHAFWQKLGSEPTMIGSSVTDPDGTLRTIVGVTPQDFGALEEVDLFVPARP